MECPACRSRRCKAIKGRIYQCNRCQAIFGTTFLGDSYEFVRPQWQTKEVKVERYFDFTCVGSKGVSRRHGWYDPETKLITQVG